MLPSVRKDFSYKRAGPIWAGIMEASLLSRRDVQHEPFFKVRFDLNCHPLFPQAFQWRPVAEALGALRVHKQGYGVGLVELFSSHMPEHVSLHHSQQLFNRWRHEHVLQVGDQGVVLGGCAP